MPPPRRLADSNEICTELYEEQLREQAIQYVPSAVGKLAELAESGPAAVARQACNDLITHAHKKPVTAAEGLGNLIGDGNINITVTLQAGGEGKALMMPTVNAPVAVPDEVEDAEIVDEDEGSAPDPLLNIRVKGLKRAT